MSKGPWRIEPVCGVSMRKLEMAGEDYLDDDGKFDTGLLPDCNIFDVRSFAAACGFTDVAYFRDCVLTDLSCPIHFHRLTLADAATGRRLGEVFATHQNSADIGGKLWRETRWAGARTCDTQLCSVVP